ncbi:MAG: hypothetical protein JRN06_01305 [Nitrososphaerota archaeon]|nr:hypothetical protein [Nitrososphaerota archaeon]MDG7023511.1 hypothetical protein [Nitrososphaerota archaeon]
MNTQLLFRITGLALGIQIALGGLVTFGYMDWTIHIGWGVVLGILALVTLVFVYRMPAKSKRLVGLTVGMAADILIQAMIGFAAQDTGNNAVSWIHFLNSYAIFAMLFMGMGMAMMGSRMGQMGQTPPAAATT